MSWASLTSNQIVSTANLADAVETGVFAAKQSIPTTIPSLALTTTTAIDYAYVDVDPTFASNRLVTKASLSAANVGPGPYNYYVYGVDGNAMYQSTNGGYTFSAYTTLPFGQDYTVLAASYSGQYLLAASRTLNNTIYISNDYGASFYSHNIGNVGTSYTFTTFYPCDADMSSSGQYMVVVGKALSGDTHSLATVAISSDYGATFTAYYGAYQTARFAGRLSVAMSQNGAVICYVAVDGLNNNSWRYTSTNYGASFAYGGLSTNQLFYDVSMSSTGQYIILVNKGTAVTGNLFVSSNYGSSYTSRSTLGGGVYSGMTEDGTIMQVSGSQGTYYSTNFGVNWNTYAYSFNYEIGMAVGVYWQVPIVSNYVAVLSNANFYGISYCNYKPPSSSTTFYAQPLTYNYSINKIYRKAINY
jgi:hypothetical protein